MPSGANKDLGSIEKYCPIAALRSISDLLLLTTIIRAKDDPPPVTRPLYPCRLL